MYIISQFSKISGLTVKALRYYDEQNILKPSYRDKETLYRYYNETDVKKAGLIKLLRSLDFSISEIRETLESIENDTDLTYILQEKIQFIENHIQTEKALINTINNYLQPQKTEKKREDYKITIEEIPSVLVAAVRFTGRYNELGQYIPLLYKAVQGNVNGNIINCYYDEECVEQAAMEVCLPTKKRISSSTAECKLLPSVKAVCTTHHGSYDTLYLAYKSLFEYVNEHNLSLILPTREVYLKGPGIMFKGNPENYITKVLLPFKII